MGFAGRRRLAVGWLIAKGYALAPSRPLLLVHARAALRFQTDVGAGAVEARRFVRACDCALLPRTSPRFPSTRHAPH